MRRTAHTRAQHARAQGAVRHGRKGGRRESTGRLGALSGLGLSQTGREKASHAPQGRVRNKEDFRRGVGRDALSASRKNTEVHSTHKCGEGGGGDGPVRRGAREFKRGSWGGVLPGIHMMMWLFGACGRWWCREWGGFGGKDTGRMGMCVCVCVVYARGASVRMCACRARKGFLVLARYIKGGGGESSLVCHVCMCARRGSATQKKLGRGC